MKNIPQKFPSILNTVLRIIMASIFIGIFISLIAYARGYRFSLKDKVVTSTGIISVSAYPKGSKVYINDELKGVSDINITLPPGNYKVSVKKEGYTDWTKNITLNKEIVLTIDSLLFPKNPSLLSLTNLGVIKAVPYNQSDKIILFTQTNDPLKDGIYIYDSTKKPLSFYAPLKLLVLKKNLPEDIDLKQTQVHFSPDSQQGIFDFATPTTTYSYLFSLGEETTVPFDISASRESLVQAWGTEKNKEIAKILETFPKMLRPIAAANFSIIAFSHDQTKVLYQAKTNMVIPAPMIPEILGANQSPENRSILAGKIYVYDKKEDKNFLLPIQETLLQKSEPTISGVIKKITPTATLIPTPTQAIASDSLTPEQPFEPLYSEKEFPIVWYSDSKHLSIQQDKEIVMVDYDGDNKRTIYSGPFEKNFFFITNDGKLFILTNLNPQNNEFADLYEIGIQ